MFEIAYSGLKQISWIIWISGILACKAVQILHLLRWRKWNWVMKLLKGWKSQVWPLTFILWHQVFILNCFISYHAVTSFAEMERFILRQWGVKFLLSEWFCQDPVKEFFGHQCAKGGRNENPTVKQFCDSVVSLRVRSSAALDPICGNYRKWPADKFIHVSEAPSVPKQKRGSKWYHCEMIVNSYKHKSDIHDCVHVQYFVLH